MTQWCYGLKCPFSVGLSIPRCVAVAIPKVQTVVSCLNTFSRQKVHVIAEMAISIVILIPGGDQGDKRTVAFGASENSRPIGYLRSPVSVEIRD